MKLTKEEFDKVLDAAYDARRRVSAMTPEQKMALEKRARKKLKIGRK